MRIWPALLVVGAVLSPLKVPAAQELLSNFEMVRRGMVRAVDKALSTWPAEVETVSVEHIDNAHDLGWLGETTLAQRLSSLGTTVVSGRVSTASRWSVTCEVKSARVVFTDYHSGWLVTQGAVKRRSELALTLTLSTPDSAVSWIADGSFYDEDLVPESKVALLAGLPEEHLAPEIPRTDWAPYLESAIVSGTVGVLTFLFFTR